MILPSRSRISHSWCGSSAVVVVARPIAACAFRILDNTEGRACLFFFVSGDDILLLFVLFRLNSEKQRDKSSSIETMASRASKIAAVAREIFGTLPIRGVRTGMQYLKTPLTGAYEARFYMEPIEPIARKVRSKNSLPYLYRWYT